MPSAVDFAVGGGFCCRWGGRLPAAAADRRQPQKKGGGEICACFRTLTPLLAEEFPTSDTFAVDGFQPLPPIGDSRKKKAVGKFVPASAHSPPCLRRSSPPRILLRWMASSRCRRKATAAKKGGGEICNCLSHTHFLACGGVPHPLHFDPLTVISLSTRKSPGAAGALSLTRYRVSDPAEGATAQPAKRSRPQRSRAGTRSRASESGQGGGSGQVNPLIFFYLTFYFSMIVNSFN